jgi:hypothetical protein
MFNPSLTLTGEERNELHTAVEKAVFAHYKNELSKCEAEINRKEEVARRVRGEKMKEVLTYTEEAKKACDKECEKVLEELTFSCSDKTDEELLEYVAGKFNGYDFWVAKEKYWKKFYGEEEK